MKRELGAANSDAGSRRLAAWLIVAFSLTVASFTASTLFSEYRARGIEAAAASITNAAVPAIDHLARARTELRHIEVLLDDYVDSNGVSGRRELEQARAVFEGDYGRYLAIAPYEGEPALWTRIATSTSEMNASIDSALRAMGGGRDAADELTSRVKPAIDQVDAGLLAAIELNTRQAAELSARIAAIRREARSWGLALDALSVLLAATAAVLVTRVVGRFVRAVEARATDLEHFAGRVAHDIRSPLQSVALALDLARRRPELDAKTTTLLERGLRTLQRVGQLVDGLLVFARAGRSPPESSRASVTEVVVDVIDEMRAAAEEKEIELRVKESPSWIVCCSPGVLVSLVSNLVGNAIKYMGNAMVKRVDVRVRRAGAMVRVEVRDTGPGIPATSRERIFEPYVRAADSTVSGIGLGLATVRRLAEAHGGGAGVEANAEGGSLFWFEIPRATDDVAKDSPRPDYGLPGKPIASGS